MIFIIYLWLSLAYVLMFVKPRWGVAVYLPFFVLIPYLNEMTYFNYPVLVALLYHAGRTGQSIDWRIFGSFFFFFVAFLLIIPFQTGLAYSKQFNFWRMDVICFLSFPMFVSYIIKIDPHSIPLFRKTMLSCITVAILYGLFLTMLNGINPYLLYMSSITGFGDKSIISDYSIADGTGRLFGRIFSCFKHPMLFAYFLGLSFIYIYHIRSKINKILSSLLFILLILISIFCGVRSVIGGLAVAVAFYVFMTKNYKLFFFLVAAYFVFGFLAENISYLNDYFSSFTKEDAEIKGSSIDMRIRQFEGCLKEIEDSPLVGKGYGWSTDYLAHKGVHPTMLAFESLLFSLLCNSGFIGVSVWMIFVYMFSVNCRKMYDDSLIYVTTLVFYISYSVITGDYSYMKFFVLFIVLMLGEGQNQKIGINSKV